MDQTDHHPSVAPGERMTKSGRYRRNYFAMCSCGWAAERTDAVKRVAQERASRHATELAMR